jgi:PAC2 family
VSVTWQRDASALELQRPLMLVALEGWFDVASTATGAVRALGRAGSSEPVALIEAEEFVDLRSHRPQISILEGEVRELRWPDTTIELVRTGTRDLVLCHGIEPDYQWSAYVAGLCDIAVATGAELVITVGAGLTAVAHTQPVSIITSASSPALARRLGLALPRYQGITGVVGVLQEQLGKRDLPGVSLRAQVPHYLGGVGFPAGQRALLARIAALSGVAVPMVDDDDFAERLDDLLEEHPELGPHIAQLERQPQVVDVDADQLMNEITRYLDEGRDDG